ncbi:PRK06851 family protein [Radiobacillus kanasensis]|uniref:PRK06851 family protein n=1 Tax=Radiobacillus kanasensis TaxID=2844358 RepID=UPI001E3AC1A0|nr:PRK06851 family protein [Radiobacillus kanasensis]UFT98723.1 PRK06851 family protein [Radiobacillus kanasensis]
MTGRERNYYAGGNTAKGFYNLFDSNLQGLESVYILKGGPGTGKSSLIKRLSDTWKERGYDVERIHCSSDPDSLDGLIIPDLKFGVFDGTAPHVLEPKAPGAIENYLNLGIAWDTESLEESREEILDYQEKLSKAYENAYSSFERGLRVHDDLEDIYIKEMDFAKANEVTEELIKKVVGDEQSKQVEGTTRHRFFGASTPNGPVDFIPNLTEDLSKRYFLKGRAGTGKSTLLKKVAAAAEQKRFDVEVYHCGFDPESVDMVVIRELGVCVFDSTAPHEYMPSRHGDEIVDLYETSVTPGTDETYKTEITKFTKGYKQGIKDGVSYLKEAKELHDELEKYYIGATDFSVIDQIYENLHIVLQQLEDK